MLVQFKLGEKGASTATLLYRYGHCTELKSITGIFATKMQSIKFVSLFFFCQHKWFAVHANGSFVQERDLQPGTQGLSSLLRRETLGMRSMDLIFFFLVTQPQYNKDVN